MIAVVWPGMRGQINDHGSEIGRGGRENKHRSLIEFGGRASPHSGRTGRWTTDSACLYGVGHFRRIPVLLKAARPQKALCRISKGEFLHRPDKEVGRLSGARQHEGIARQLGGILWLQKQLWPIGLSSSGE